MISRMKVTYSNFGKFFFAAIAIVMATSGSAANARLEKWVGRFDVSPNLIAKIYSDRHLGYVTQSSVNVDGNEYYAYQIYMAGGASKPNDPLPPYPEAVIIIGESANYACDYSVLLDTYESGDFDSVCELQKDQTSLSFSANLYEKNSDLSMPHFEVDFNQDGGLRLTKFDFTYLGGIKVPLRMIYTFRN